MLKKVLIGVLAVSSTLLSANAFASAPNMYTCTGKGVSLTYAPFGTGGAFPPDPTLLTLVLDKTVYKATKKNIETSKSVMGEVKSITLKFIPDVSIQKASFILPQINLDTNFLGNLIDKVNFKSQLALTTIATPFIATPFVGIVNKSTYIDLSCKASLVFFPL